MKKKSRNFKTKKRFSIFDNSLANLNKLNPFAKKKITSFAYKDYDTNSDEDLDETPLYLRERKILDNELSDYIIDKDSKLQKIPIK